jgi:type III restriction enzyme
MSAPSFYEKPILNSPYEVPKLHHHLDEDGQPTDNPPVAGRRRSEFITPVPKARKQKRDRADEQKGFTFKDDTGASSENQEYNPTPIINEIRQHVATWRGLPNERDWKVEPATARLLNHWRHHNFNGIRPFFCQVEAVETIIWLTEVARKSPAYKKYWDHVVNANAQANPELLRLAMKMATGAGKTTVMAMLIAWQTVNAVRNPNSKNFTRGFLIVAPGITIKDRLRVLEPQASDSYYKSREIVPDDMLEDINKAKIVITNYHAFQLKETLETNKVGRSLLQGRGEEIRTKETEGQMVRRVAGDLMGLKNIVVINDEAHHCYREKANNTEIDELKGEEKKEAKQQNEYARLWINGLEAVKRKLGVRAVYDLSATPFFLAGSGYAEGTLFPWVISDFSLIDAIECGIVKLPRIPVADNIPGEEFPVFRDLWKHIAKEMPKKGRSAGGGEGDPEDIPDKLKTALNALYGHYVKTDEEWRRAGIDVPPVFIVVCNNTATSKLVYEWISGWERPNADGESVFQKHGHLPLFQNYDQYGQRLPKPNTLLIDSQQLESGEALDKDFRTAAGPEIEQFKRELALRAGAADASDVTDAELLREVMNTVGRKGKLGEQIRCVVSVSMLTEGWDTNTVTHILGVRAFGTQLLCEQVVGRGLRRYSYDLNDEGLFNVEYSDIMGIPFNFAAKPVVAAPKPPQARTHVKAVKERERLELVFPRVSGYRYEFPQERLEATFTEDSTFVLDPSFVGPGETLMQGIVGEPITLTVAEAQETRPSTLAFELAGKLMVKYFKDENGEPKIHLVGQLKSIARRWIKDHFKCVGGAAPWMLQYPSVAAQACERIYHAIARAQDAEKRIKAVLDPYNPKGSSRFVSFHTTKETYQTDARKSHVDHVVLDSDWEAEFARIAEDHPKVLSYVKNQGLGLEVPYKDGPNARTYIPDFILAVDDGRGVGDPLYLIGEVKGYRGENVKLKSQTMETQWVPGVNRLGTFGRWAFHEFRSVFDFREELDEVIAAHSVPEAAE